ncbi:CpsB/CapC family capsule biosynthesis tyrosine phosphatase [Clostridium sp. WILCCON 0269]|uniref:Histidinol-phosphatase n=1 Tax=Candidatus Clostridium eludens TaxID=3381663 RepID=A0ABW8SEA2_9CLOT
MFKESLIDLHNHSLWSDGINTTKEIIENAIKHNISTIGITDHLQTNKYLSVKFTQVDSYMKELLGLKTYYKNRIKVLIGIEISIFECLKYVENIPFKALKVLDYVLIECLENLAPRIPVNNIEVYLQKFTCRLGLAHTNLLKLANNHGGLVNITKFLSKNNIFWEINSNSMYEFFDDIIIQQNNNIHFLIDLIRDYKINISVGSDTHDLNNYEFGRLYEANRVAETLNRIII